MGEHDERIVVAGGGTGGHVNPGLAIAGELRRRRPARAVVFVGTAAGLEARLVPAAGYPLETIRASGLVGMEGAVVTMQEVFRFVTTGQEQDGKIRGHFEATGIVPRCVDRLRLAGAQLSASIFERGRRVPRAA